MTICHRIIRDVSMGRFIADDLCILLDVFHFSYCRVPLLRRLSYSLENQTLFKFLTKSFLRKVVKRNLKCFRSPNGKFYLLYSGVNSIGAQSDTRMRILIQRWVQWVTPSTPLPADPPPSPTITYRGRKIVL